MLARSGSIPLAAIEPNEMERESAINKKRARHFV
jgi:hypothetical protein